MLCVQVFPYVETTQHSPSVQFSLRTLKFLTTYDTEKKFAQGLAEGGPVESEIDKALSDIQSVQPEAQAIQQVMTMVMEMIQSGASEEQIVAALKEMGLDDEDIQQVMMMVAEEMAGQDSIDGQLAQMM